MTEQRIQIYASADGRVQLEVTQAADTLWLTQAQIAELFGVKPQNITMHLKHIYKEQELTEPATCKDFLQVQIEGTRRVNRKRKLYNLDAILSVGYRVNSRQATQFRMWATNTLKQHLVEGYTLNQRRLEERGVEFEQALTLLSKTLTNRQLISEQGYAVVSVIHDYARSWSLLHGYDEQSLSAQTARQTEMTPLEINEIRIAISQLKQELIGKGEASELFAQQCGDGLESAINTIEQGFGGQWFYPNIASRAAHLLYLVIKNHPLTDGNKRTGSFLFLWYLRINQHLLAKPVDQLINDNTLVALALLVAESQPEQKELMIRLVEHFILLKNTE